MAFALKTYTKWGRRNTSSLVWIVGMASITGLGCGLYSHSNSDFIKYRVKEDQVVSQSTLARKRAAKEFREMNRIEKEREKIFDDRFFGEETSEKK